MSTEFIFAKMSEAVVREIWFRFKPVKTAVVDVSVCVWTMFIDWLYYQYPLMKKRTETRTQEKVGVKEKLMPYGR
jgi:hypothetical protein